MSMEDTTRAAFLPTTPADMRRLGWDAPDFVYVVGDAYVDHPSFGHAIISRVLQKHGYRVAMLCQPDWRDAREFTRLGRPRLGFLVTAGNIDSMVNHYTAAKKPRSEDSYAPGGRAGCRPDRATIVYCNRIREAYGDIPIVIGGIEASLRRFAHYDYWDDRVRNSILVDSGADLLLYGMGERSVVEAARRLETRDITPIRGSCEMTREPWEGYDVLHSAEQVQRDKLKYNEAFLAQYDEQDPVRGRGLCQAHGKRYLVAHPPQLPLTTAELDAVHALPYQYAWHPDYDEQGGVPAIEEVKFSIMATRGCFGACNFCALTFHQGRVVSARSHASVLAEARKITHLPGFKGYIHDVGGPTANFRRPACGKQLKSGACKHRQCMFPEPCKSLEVDHSEFIKLLRELRALPGVKKVFVRSGLRYDYMLADRSSAFLNELVRHHISGQLKVAPEHVAPRALRYMGKPDADVYREFVNRYKQANERAGMQQYLVPYFMSSHPGCELSDAILLAEFLRDTGSQPEQVQDFYPTPGTLSTAMFYTGRDPRSGEHIYVARSPQEKGMQRALMQYRRPQNHALVRKALRICARDDLIGYGKHCLVPPEPAPARGPARTERAPGARRESGGRGRREGRRGR